MYVHITTSSKLHKPHKKKKTATTTKKNSKSFFLIEYIYINNNYSIDRTFPQVYENFSNG